MAKHDKVLERDEKQIFSYDKDNDILVIHKGYKDGEVFKGNFEAGNIILDMSSRGRIRGIEINNANLFLRNLNLSNVVDANFNASTNPNGININILFKFKNKTEFPAAIAVSLETPIKK